VVESGEAAPAAAANGDEPAELPPAE